jgi:hypothetical protein
MKTLAPLAAGLVLSFSALAPGLAATPTGLADLAWLTGSWRAEQADGSVVTETWLAADGGVMPGVGRTIAGGKAQVEFMRLDEKDGKLAFTAIVGRQPPVTFPLKSARADELVFENLAHDFPQRVILRRCGAGYCPAIEGTLNGKLERMVWTYVRQP